MAIARTDIMTLQTAVRMLGIDSDVLPRLRKELEGKALKHLGWQDDRGWFYREEDIIQAFEELVLEEEARRA